MIYLINENQVMMQQGNGGLAKKGSVSVAGKKKASKIKVSRKGVARISQSKVNKLTSALKNNKGLTGLRKNVKSQKGFDSFVKAATSRTNKRGDKKDVGMAALRRLSGLPKSDFDKKMASAIERGVVQGGSGSTRGVTGSTKQQKIYSRQQITKQNIRNNAAALKTATGEINLLRGK